MSISECQNYKKKIKNKCNKSNNLDCKKKCNRLFIKNWV